MGQMPMGQNVDINQLQNNIGSETLQKIDGINNAMSTNTLPSGFSVDMTS